MSAHSGTGCMFCEGASAPPTILLQSPRWNLYRHADPTPIAGWMMVATRHHDTGLDVMCPQESAELGVILRAMSIAVRAVTGGERVYALTYNEAVQHLHLHAIPRFAADARTKSWALADFYRAVQASPELAVPADVATDTAESIVQHLLSQVQTDPLLERVGFARLSTAPISSTP